MKAMNKAMDVVENIRSVLKNMRGRRRTARINEEIFSIRDFFYLEEVSGKVYIVHGGIAILEFGNTADVEQIATLLEKARQTATKHHIGKKIKG